MEFSDIPAAVSIFIVMLSVFLGATTILTGKRKTVELRPTASLDQGSPIPLRIPGIRSKNVEASDDVRGQRSDRSGG
jgi:hypothetical protein